MIICVYINILIMTTPRSRTSKGTSRSSGRRQAAQALTHPLFQKRDPELLFSNLEQVGRGSFGAVYKATSIEDGGTVAIKKIASSKKNDKDWQEIFKEIEVLNDTRHEFIVAFCGAFYKSRNVWIVMEFCIGSVCDILSVFHSFEEPETAAVIFQLLQALVFLHGHGKIHRDIKGSNILLSSTGNVKLADFGSSSLKNHANTFVGTPYWMAPEVIMAMDDGIYNTKADIWSVGITCIELAQRRAPLMDMPSMSALYHIPTAPSPTFADPDKWGENFRDFTAKCLIKTPEERWSASQLLGHVFVRLNHEEANRTLKNLIDRSIIEVDKKDTEMMQGMIDRFVPQHDKDTSESNSITGESELDDQDNKVIEEATKQIDIEFLIKNTESEDSSGSLNRRLSTYRTLRSRRESADGPSSQRTSIASNQHSEPTLRLRTLVLENQDDFDVNQKQDFAQVRLLIKGQHKTRNLKKKQMEHELTELFKQHEHHLQKLKLTFQSEIAKLESQQRAECESINKEESHELRHYFHDLDDMQKVESKESDAAKRMRKKSEGDILGTLTKRKSEVETFVREKWKRKNLDLSKQHLHQWWDQKENFMGRLAEMKIKNAVEIHKLRLTHTHDLHSLIIEQSVDQSVKEGEILNRSHQVEKKKLVKKHIEEMKKRPKFIKKFKLTSQHSHMSEVDKMTKLLRQAAEEEMVGMTKEKRAERLKVLKREEMQMLAELGEEFSQALTEALQSKTLELDNIQTEEYKALEQKQREEMSTFQKLVTRKEKATFAKREPAKEACETDNSKEMEALQKQLDYEHTAFMEERRIGLQNGTRPHLDSFTK